jgi:hypothetical protein
MCYMIVARKRGFAGFPQRGRAISLSITEKVYKKMLTRFSPSLSKGSH